MKISFSFIIFFAVFVTLYGLLHFYLYRKVINAFSPGMYAHLILIFALLLLLFSPILIRMLPEENSNLIVTAANWITYIWMGSIFLFFSFFVLIDLYRLIIFFSSRVFTASLLNLLPPAKTTLLTVVVLVAAINLYGLYEAGSISVEKVILKTQKLPSSLPSFRIVQISDIHFSRTNGLKLARKITGIIDELEPDLLVSTGDLIDDGLLEKEKVERLFSALDIRYGKFAATGNHEFISGIKKTSEFTVNSGFRLLRNETVHVTDFLNIAAVDDPAGNRFGAVSNLSEEKIFSGLSSDRITLFLKHQPRVEKNSIGRFDLQLSGHTHNGQIFPFRLIVSLFYPYMSGLYELKDGSYIYVNRGTGTWGPPVRFLSPPEITVIEFVREEP